VSVCLCKCVFVYVCVGGRGVLVPLCIWRVVCVSVGVLVPVLVESCSPVHLMDE